MNEVATQKPKSPLARFKETLKAMNHQGEFDMLPSNVSFDAFRNAAIVAVTDNPNILRCTPESVFKAVRKIAAAGLVPDGQEAAIVPFKNQATAIPMVRGLVKAARNSGEVVSLWSEIVREGEDFTMRVEDGERVFQHDFDPFSRSGDVVGVYAVARLKDGTVELETMGRDDIEKRRRASASQRGNEPAGVWKDWYEEMARKTVIRALCKRLPVSSEDLRRVMVEHDEVSFDPEQARDVTPDKVPLAQRMMAQEPESGAMEGEVMPPEGDTPPDETARPTEDDIEAAAPMDNGWDAGAEAWGEGRSEDELQHEDRAVLAAMIAGHRAAAAQENTDE